MTACSRRSRPSRQADLAAAGRAVLSPHTPRCATTSRSRSRNRPAGRAGQRGPRRLRRADDGRRLRRLGGDAGCPGPGSGGWRAHRAHVRRDRAARRLCWSRNQRPEVTAGLTLSSTPLVCGRDPLMQTRQDRVAVAPGQALRLYVVPRLDRVDAQSQVTGPSDGLGIDTRRAPVNRLEQAREGGAQPDHIVATVGSLSDRS